MKRKTELVFKIAYLLLVLISFNVLFARHWFMPYISYAVVALGVLVGALRLVSLKNYLNAGVFLLLSFTCSYMLGAINTFRYGYIDNVKAVVWMAVQYFLIFAFDKSLDYENERNILFKVFLGYTGLAATVSLGMMIVGWQYYSYLEGGIYWVFGGFIDNRLWGCYVDPNYGAVLSLISVLISVYFLTEKEKLKTVYKALLIVNIVVEFLYFCYSDSRTGLLAVIASIPVVTIAWLAKTKGFLKSIAMSMAFVIVTVGAIYGVRWVTSTARIEIARISAERAGFSQEEIAQSIDLARIGRHDDQIGEGKDVSNNRFRIWGNAIEMFKQCPIVGISFRNIREYANENISRTFTYYESMHNFFFDVLVSQGIVGITILFAFIAWIIRSLIKKYKILTEFREFAFLLAIIAAVFASMLTYSETFYMNTGGAFMFWYVLGYLVNFKENKSEENVELIEEVK